MLTLSSAPDPVISSPDRTSSILPSQNGTNILLRNGSSLLNYRLTGSPSLAWQAKDIFGNVQVDSSGIDKYPFIIGDFLNTGNANILLWRADDGIRGASLQSSPSDGNIFETVYRRDNRFGDIYGFHRPESIFLWDFFFGNSKSFGLFTRDNEGTPKIYILKSSALPQQRPTMFKEIKEVTSKLSHEWSNTENDILLERMEKGAGPKEHFLVWGEAGLSIYKFEDKELTRVLKVNEIQKNSKSDKLFLCNFGENETFKDILVSSGTTLKVYKYDEKAKTYSRVATSTHPFWQADFASTAIVNDINGDGKDELVYNGADGITALSFDYSTWNKTLSSNSFGKPLEVIGTSLIFMDYSGNIKFAEIESPPVIQITSDPDGRAQGVTSCPSFTPFSSIDFPVEEPEAFSFQASSHPSIPLDTIGLTRKPCLRWEDRWDISQILKGTVDVQNSKARVAIPLAELRVSTEISVSIGMEYQSKESLDENKKDSSVLGNGGWSLIAPMEAIIADRRNIQFPGESPEYFLFTNGEYKELEIENISGSSKKFKAKLDDGQTWELVYDLSKEKWTVTCEKEARFYGGTPATKKELIWPYWLGSKGTDLSALKEMTTAWYLTERKDISTNKTLTFTYQIQSKRLPSPNHSKSYTNSIQIKTIEDDKDSKINFRYEPKPRNEYEAVVAVKNNEITFPIAEEKNLYLKSLSLETSGYQQEFQFNYKLVGGNRYLEELQQRRTPNSFSSIFKFTYGSSHQLELISGGGINPFTVQYSYSSVTIPIPSPISISQANSKPSLEIGDGTSVKTAKGENFLAVGYKSTDGSSVDIQILSKSFDTILTENVNYLTTVESPSVLRAVESFEIVAMDQCVIILETLKTVRDITVFCRPGIQKSSKWSKSWSSGSLGEKDKLSFASNAFGIVREGSSSVTIFSSVSSTSPSFVKTGPFELSQFDAGSTIQNFGMLSSKDVIIYRGNLLHLKKVGTWHATELFNAPPQETNWLNEVKLNEDLKQQILKRINEIKLQIIKNAIFLLSFNYDGYDLTVKANLFLFSKNDFKHQQITLCTLKMIQLRKDMYEDIGIFTVRYRKRHSRWSPTVTNIYGSKFEAIMKEELRGGYNSWQNQEAFKQTYMDSYQNVMNNNPPILFELEDVIGYHLNGDENPILNKVKVESLIPIYEMKGDSWHSTNRKGNPEEAEYPLGDNFNLKVEKGTGNTTIYTLFSKNNSRQLATFEINSKQGGDAIIAYPKYIAYQTTNQTEIQVFPLDKDSFHLDRQTIPGEMLIKGSDSDWLITASNSTVNFRRSAEFLITVPKTVRVLTGNEITCGDHKMKRNFETKYDWLRRHLLEKKVTMWYGESKATSGWIETSFIQDKWSSDGNATKIDKWFNGETGEIVASKTLEYSYIQKDTKNNTESVPQKKENNSKIKDLTGNWEMSDISPYILKHDMFGFIGFENYENLTEWNFPKDKIITSPGAFSLTGESYLNLAENQNLSRKFTPKDQFGSYLVSSWIRCSNPNTCTDKESFLKVKVQLNPGEIHWATFLSEVKRTLDNGWTYLEAVLDLPLLRKQYSIYYEKKKSEIIKEVFSGSEGNSSSFTNYTLGLPPLSNSSISLEIKLTPVGAASLDIDHVRFFPIQSDFSVSVFKENSTFFTTPQVYEEDKVVPPIQSIILGNGEIVNKIYDESDIQEIGGYTEEGKVDQWTSIGKWSGGKSTLTLNPEEGFYETFDSQSLKWTTSPGNSFKVKKGQLWHESKLAGISDRITFKSQRINSTAFRFRYHFDDENNSDISLNWSSSGSSPQIKVSLKLENFQVEAKLTNGTNEKSFEASANGEIIMYLEDNQGWLFIDGSLLSEFTTPTDNLTSFFIDFQGNGRKMIKDLIVLYKPELTMQYFNIWGQQIQTIKLETINSAQVSSTLYDQVGREAIRTKTSRVTRNEAACLLCYHLNYVTNGQDHFSANSVFKTGRLEGLVTRLNPGDEGYPYSRTVYEATPLEEKLCEGRPGKRFACGEENNFVKTTPKVSGIARLFNLFPPSNGFKEKVEKKPNGSVHVTILNLDGQEVAHYVHVPGFDHLLSTNEFDKSGRITRILPPLYHSKANTMSRTTPWKFGDSIDDFTQSELLLQRKLATKFTYDEYGNMIKKETADSRTRHYLYDQFGNKRFSYFLTGNQTIAENIAYYLYTEQKNIAEAGTVIDSVPEEKLKEYLELYDVPRKLIFQVNEYYETHDNPQLRGKLRTVVTYNEPPESFSSAGNATVMETISFNSDDKVAAKKFSSTSNPESKFLEKVYKGGRVTKIVYPSTSVNGDKLHLVHSYDKAGNLLGIGTPEDPFYFAKYSWIPGGIIKKEEVRPSSCENFTRTFSYDSPGHLVEISDPFLTEKLDYVENGYGQEGFGDGIVMRTNFNATWASSPAYAPWFQIDQTGFNLTEIPVCINAIKRLGFLSDNSIHTKPLKLLRTSDFPKLPGRCKGQTGVKLSNMLKIKLPPSENYGHMYAYGNHNELTQAKYFDKLDKILKPLTSQSFQDIPGITSLKSKDIWRILKSANVFATNQSGADEALTGKGFPGNIINEIGIAAELDAAEENLGTVIDPILNFILECPGKHTPSLEDFEEILISWKGGKDIQLPRALQTSLKKSAEIAFNLLKNENYLNQNSQSLNKLLNPNFLQALASLQLSPRTTKKVVDLLLLHFKNQLGENPFDLESYKIDANGNHKEFTVGEKRYKLVYENGNQISEIHESVYGDPDTPFIVHNISHDDHGNMKEAPHHKIKSILYHPISNRPTQIDLEDGKVINFEYDGAGERSRKYVKDSDGKMIYELHYFRDEKGRVLLDHRLEYEENGTEVKKETKSRYIYGARGYILGFLRNNKFFSVHVDGAGSTRLVTQAGKVVAAYDYLPYGEFMRKFGVDPEGQLTILYTGQEYDEETGLYNFHARLYDPLIGRFLQMDPMGQMFSPYAYSGNSPISFTDPDGQFFFTLTCILIGAAIGAYLGGAAANGTFNIAKWKWDNKTLFGVLGGALAGALLPIGIAGSVATIGVTGTIIAGVVVAGINTAVAFRAQKNFDILDPNIIFAAFTGFATGVGLVGGTGSLFRFASELGKVGKVLLVSTSFALGTGLAYKNMAEVHGGNYKFWEWDKIFTPESIMARINGFDTGMGWPMGFLQVGKGGYKALKNIFKTKPALFMKNLGRLKRLDVTKVLKQLKLAKHAHKKLKSDIIKGASALIMTYYYVSAANGDFNPEKWDLTKFSTYEAALNGVFFGKDIKSMLKHIRKSKTEKSNQMTFKKQNNPNKISFKKIGKDFNQMMYKIMMKKLKVTLKKYKIPDLFEPVRSAFLGKTKPNSLSTLKFPNGALDIPMKIKVAQQNAAESSKIFHNADLDNVNLGSKKKINLEDGGTLKIENDDSKLRRHLEEAGSCGGGSRRKRNVGNFCSQIIQNEDSANLFEEAELLNIMETNEFTKVVFEPNPSKSLVSDGVDRPPKRQKIKDKVYYSNEEGTTNSLAEAMVKFLSEIPTKATRSSTNQFSKGAIEALVDGYFIGNEVNENVKSFINKIQLNTENRGFIEVDVLHVLKYSEKGNPILTTFIIKEGGMLDYSDVRKGLANNINSYLTELGITEDIAHRVIIIYKARENQETINTNVYVFKPRFKNIEPENKVKFDDKIFTPLENIESAKKLKKWWQNDDSSTNFGTTNKLVSDFFKKNERLLLPETNSELKSAIIKHATEEVNFTLEFIKSAVESFRERHNLNNGDGKETIPDSTLNEESFQGYIYGLLRFHLAKRRGLIIRAEMTSGLGYTDIVMVATKTASGEPIPWSQRVPVVIELKKGSPDPADAIKQILDRGYANNLFLQHYSKYALLISANAGIVTPSETTSNNPSVLGRLELIPTKMVLANEFKNFVFETAESGKGRKELLEAITKSVKWAGSTISHECYKKGSFRDYLTSRLIGQLVQKPTGNEASSLKAYPIEFSRSQDKAVTGILLKSRDGTQIPVYVRVVEVYSNQKAISNPEYISPNAFAKAGGDTLRVVNIVVDAKTNNVNEFVKQVTTKEVTKSENDNKKPEKPTLNDFKNIDPLPEIDSDLLLHGNPEDPVVMAEWKKLSKLNQNLGEISKAEHNLQGLLHGLFERPDVNGNVQNVFMEVNPSDAGRVDLVVTNFNVNQGDVISNSHKITAIEIKQIKSEASHSVVENAIEQSNKYFGYEVGSDAKQVSKLTVVFDQSDNPKIHMKTVDLSSAFASMSISSGSSKRPYSRMRREAMTGNTTKVYDMNSPKSISSASSSIHSGLGPVSILKSFVNSIKTLWEGVNAKQSAYETINQKHIPEESKIHELNCQRGAWNGDSYEMDAVTCKNGFDSSHAAVFYKGREDPGALLDFNLGENVLLGDNFTRSSCKPLEFNKIPSVTCSGEKTDFVYTPDLSYFNKTFDSLDGQIMLGAVIFNQLRKDFAHFFSKAQEEVLNKEEEVFVGKDELEGYGIKINEIQEILQQLDKTSSDKKFNWAKHNLDDIFEEMGEDEEATWTKAKKEILEERLAALYDDLMEEIELTAEKSEEFFSTESSFKTEMGQDEQDIDINWSSFEATFQNIWNSISSNGSSGNYKQLKLT